MAVTIRLSRHGKKKQPFYHMVVADQRFKRDGRFIEKIGFFDPRKDSSRANIELTRYEHWVKLGAQATDTVKKIVKEFKKQPQEATEA